MSLDEDEVAIFAAEIAAGVAPILVCDNGDGDEIPFEASASAKKKGKRTTFVPPTFIEIYPQMAQQNICAVSVEKKLRSCWSKWKSFWEHSGFAGQPWSEGNGLGLYNNSSDIQNSKDYNHQTVDGFLQWLSETSQGKSVLKGAKTFLNTHLKCEHFSRLQAKGLYGALVSVCVGESLAIKKSCQAVNARAAQLAMDGCFDIQADLDQLLHPTKFRELLTSVFMCKPDGPVQKLNVVYRLIYACVHCTLSQTTRRGEELYQQKLVQRTTAQLPEIGRFGMKASVFVTNKAKHNAEGWLEYTSALPHMNPLFDSSSWQGLLLLWRILICHEVFPRFTGNSNYKEIFQIFSYPASNDPTKHLEPKTCGEIFDAFFLECDAVCAKKVHQPRFQAIQEMDRAGISEVEWTRMTGHKGKQQKVQHRSYAHNTPSRPLVQRAGGDPSDLKNFHPAHFIASPDEQHLLDEVVLALVPDLVEQKKLADIEYSSAKKHEARTSKRLTTIKSLLGGAINDVEHCVLMLASPLVDPATYLLVEDKRSLWALYHNDSLAPLLNQAAFKLPAFAKLQVSTLAKMTAANEFSSSLNSESKCAMEKYVKDHLARPMMLHHQENRQIMNQCSQVLGIILKQEPATVGSSRAAFVTPDKDFRDSPMDLSGKLLFPGGSPTLADGRTPRKRKAPVSQSVAISSEYKRRDSSGKFQGESIELLCDKGLITLEDYWFKYKNDWKPKEAATGGAWRKDFAFNSDGTRLNHRKQWWTQRRSMFEVIEHYMDVEDLSEENALAKANLLYTGIDRKAGKRKPPIKEINRVFKKELSSLGIKKNGRPRKQGKARTSTDVDEFANAFPLNASQTLHYEQEQLNQQMDSWRMERERQQASVRNDNSRWAYANRNLPAAATVPVTPINYGTLHPFPYRPVPGQPPTELPPGHQHATL